MHAGAAPARITQAQMPKAAMVCVEECRIWLVMPMQHAIRMAGLHQRCCQADRIIPAFAAEQHVGMLLPNTARNVENAGIRVVPRVVEPHGGNVEEHAVEVVGADQAVNLRNEPVLPSWRTRVKQRILSMIVVSGAVPIHAAGARHTPGRRRNRRCAPLFPVFYSTVDDVDPEHRHDVNAHIPCTVAQLGKPCCSTKGGSGR